MSVNDISLFTRVQDPQDNPSVDKNVQQNVCTTNDVVGVEQKNLEILHCFVCDSKVQGRCYSLATCKTQNSRARIIEKLGELVGERYVVVISEDDVICRSCANLINTLDRLENEMRSVKSAVLRFLERKYSLAEGELQSCSELPRLGQPPQIMRNDSQSNDYNTRKRAASEDTNCPKKMSKKSNVWMQCDKCHYTTLTDTFMSNHMSKHTREKKKCCDKYGVELPKLQTSNHLCKEHVNDDNSVETENPEEGEARAIQTAPVETIDLAGTVEDIDEDNNVTSIPVISIPSNIESTLSSKDEQIQLINLTNPNNLQFQNFLGNDESSRDGQPLLMRVLQQLGVGDELEQGTLIPLINNEATIKITDTSTKQMLTLAEDGSLEMVAVDCWNDENQIERDHETII